MRRWLVVFVALAVLTVACTGGSSSTEAETSTSGLTVTTAEVVEPTTTIPADTSTTGNGQAWPAVEVLVTNDDGVFLVDSEGEVTQLVKGRVAYAVDDTRGGLLFQVERGRSTVWASWQSVYRQHLKDTRVWWVPRGSAAARALLVPTPEAGQDLVLYDAYQGEDGHVRVVYVRSDTPEADHPFGISDSLRVFDAATTAVTEVWKQGAWEEGFAWVSAGAGPLAATYVQQIGTRCFFVDPEAGSEPGREPTSGDSWIHVAGAPLVDPACEECCQSMCVLSPDGELLAFASCSQVAVTQLQGADPQQLFEFDDIAGLDLTNTHLLVNQYAEAGEFAGVAVLVDISSRSEAHIPIPGSTRFVTALVDIVAPVVPPTPAAIQLRADGLGVVGFGDPLDETVSVLTALFGPPVEEWAANSIPGIDWGGGWDVGDGFLWLHLVVWDYFDTAPQPSHPVPPGPVLVYYSTDSHLFATEAGIRVGSSARELRHAYPAFRLGDGCGLDPDRPIVVVEAPPGAWLRLPMFFTLDGDIGDPDSRVVGISAGYDVPSC